MAADIAVPSPLSNPVTEVFTVITGVVVGVATSPANPLAVATETFVTVPVPTPPEKDPDAKKLPSSSTRTALVAKILEVRFTFNELNLALPSCLGAFIVIPNLH